MDTSNTTTISPKEATLLPARNVRAPSEGRDVARDITPSRPCFSVSASTTNAPLAIAIGDAPPNAHLALSARAYRALARVTLHPTYEGAFALEAASPFVPELNWPCAGMTDPAGRGRTLVHEETHFAERGRVEGWVGWGPVDGVDAQERGRVWVAQSRGEAMLGWGPSDYI